ncbi:iron-containing alcohol dehydrogenase [Parasphingorhabdus sp.]|uniref:iron-containing alcohol dehydrogenase n=1 Tax=Parasphingorhabdus sp. TaxID=2709688 RepID=UPI00329836E0
MFSFVSPQAIHFGRGQRHIAAKLAGSFGRSVLVVHGSARARAEWLIEGCEEQGLSVTTIACAREPALPDIQQALERFARYRPDVILALGGGSVMDFAKSVSALIGCSGPAKSYLELVGDGRGLDQAPVPLIALPTTAGTGAEVTKNAVLSVPEKGMKVSLRDPRMVPVAAIVDADLMQGAPKRVALSAALDAITQVIEPYLSTKATLMTDALCFAAIPIGLLSLRSLVEDDDGAAWDEMAWVSTCGGLALANAGLGAVHGFAGVIGGKTGAPHGEICGALLPHVLQSHVEHAIAGTEIHDRIEWVCGQINRHFADNGNSNGISKLAKWSAGMGLRNLTEMGLSADHHIEVARASQNASSMKATPFPLDVSELVMILREAS